MVMMVTRLHRAMTLLQVSAAPITHTHTHTVLFQFLSVSHNILGKIPTDEDYFETFPVLQLVT